MHKKKKQKFEIELLSKHYLQSKRMLREHEDNVIRCHHEKLRVLNKVVNHIEYVVESLEEPDRFIIQKEVIEGKRGKWYLEYLSSPSYYRHRSRAYEEFLRCL